MLLDSNLLYNKVEYKLGAHFMNNNLIKKTILYCLLLSMMITLAACSKDEKDAKSLQALDKQVAGLYNDEHTDLAENIKVETIEEIDQEIEKAGEKSFDEANTKLYQSIVSNYDQARQLFDFEEEVNSLIHQNGEFDESEFWELKERLVDFDAFELFQERHEKNLKKIEKAYKVAKHNKKTEKALAKLFTKDNEVIDDITQAAYDEVKELVSKVEDEETRKRFERLLEKIHVKLKEVLLAEEEAARLAEEERAAELDNEQEEEDDETNQDNNTNQTPTNDWQPTSPSRPSYTPPSRPARPSSPSQSNSSPSPSKNDGGQGNSGGNPSGSSSGGSSSNNSSGGSSSSGSNNNQTDSSSNNSTPPNDNSNHSSSNNDKDQSIGDAYKDNE